MSGKKLCSPQLTDDIPGYTEPMPQSLASVADLQPHGNASAQYTDPMPQSLSRRQPRGNAAAMEALKGIRAVRSVSPKGSTISDAMRSSAGQAPLTEAEKVPHTAARGRISTALKAGELLCGPDRVTQTGAGHVAHSLGEAGLNLAMAEGTTRTAERVAAGTAGAREAAWAKAMSGGLGRTSPLAALDAVLPDNPVTTPVAKVNPASLVSGGLAGGSDLLVAAANAAMGDTRTANQQIDQINQLSFDKGYTPIDQVGTWAAEALVDPHGTASKIIDPAGKSGLVGMGLDAACRWGDILIPGLTDCSEEAVYEETHRIERWPTRAELIAYCDDHMGTDPMWCAGGVTRVDDPPAARHPDGSPDYGPLWGRLIPEHRHNFETVDVPEKKR
jgi:hypothetical protein